MYNPSVKPYARAESPPAKASFATRSIETSRLDGLNFWSGHDPTDPTGSAVPETVVVPPRELSGCEIVSWLRNSIMAADKLIISRLARDCGKWIFPSKRGYIALISSGCAWLSIGIRTFCGICFQPNRRIFCQGFMDKDYAGILGINKVHDTLVCIVYWHIRTKKSDFIESICLKCPMHRWLNQ